MVLTDIFFPKQCIVCSRIGFEICDKCITHITRSLPKCMVCGKINTKGDTHLLCSKNLSFKLSYIQGWDIPYDIYMNFRRKRDLSIYSTHKYLLEDLLERSNIQNKLFRVIPIQNNPIDRFLVSHVYSDSNSKHLCVVGENIPDRYQLIQRLEKYVTTNRLEDVLVISLFNCLEEQDHL